MHVQNRMIIRYNYTQRLYIKICYHIKSPLQKIYKFLTFQAMYINKIIRCLYHHTDV